MIYLSSRVFKVGNNTVSTTPLWSNQDIYRATNGNIYKYEWDVRWDKIEPDYTYAQVFYINPKFKDDIS